MTSSRKFVYYVLTFLLVLLAVELLAQATYYAIYKQRYRFHKLSQYTASLSYLRNDLEVPGHLAHLAIHPYFGFFVPDPEFASSMGFGWPVSPLETRKSKDRLRVLLLGGSVAVQTMSSHTGEGNFLGNALRDALRDAGLEIDTFFFRAALPGFKQPQQLNAYSYLLSQGAKFDLVINLDGFNEMTLAILEGLPKGLNPGYPRGWDVMLGRQFTGAKLKQIGELLRIRQAQDALIEFGREKRIARSALVGLYLTHSIVNHEQRASELIKVVEREGQQGQFSVEETGPTLGLETDEDYYRYLVSLWRRSSVLMSQLSKANGAEYLHVFQPNQYLEGSKPLSEEERARYYAPDAGFGPPYRATYPYFSQEMERLREEGVWFVDASTVFKEEERTVYVDVCCHFNKLGLTTLTRFIADQVVSHSRIIRSKGRNIRSGTE